MTQATLFAAPQPASVPMQTITTLAQLQIHHAHDRTRYDLDKLAGLTMQVVQRDLDGWQPVTAALQKAALKTATQAANGHANSADSPAPDTPPTTTAPKFQIISGHRRWLARILAYGVQEWAQMPQYADRIEQSGGIDLGFVRELLTEIVGKLGGVQLADTAQPAQRLAIPRTLSAEAVHRAAGQLLQLYGDREIAVAEFTGNAKAQVLALQAANANREDPDPLGLARSYKAAYEAGATPAEIARHSGVHTDYVLNHLALTQIPAALAEAIAADKLPMGMARQIAGQDVLLRDGVAAFVLLSLRGKEAATVRGIKAALKRLRNWTGIQVPLAGLHRQSQRNIARILATLWQRALADNATHAWSAAVEMAYHDRLAEPWLDREVTAAWFELLDTKRLYRDANHKLNWQAIVCDLLLPVSCDTCAIGQLPREQLQSDIGEGRDGAIGIPCRLHKVGEHDKCLHGYAPDDPLQIPVPFDWGTHPGVVRENGGYVVKSAETLRTAWARQMKLELQAAEQGKEAEAEAKAAQLAESTESTAPSMTTATGTSATSQATAEGEPATATETKVSAETTSAPTPTKGDSKTQARIRKYMEQAPNANPSTGSGWNHSHPFATPCATCRHKLDASPVKSNSNAPHCGWAKGNRALSFTELNAITQDTGFQPVLVCRQYAPTGSWRDRIPAQTGDLPLPRTWFVAQIETFAKELGQRNRAYTGHTTQIAQYPLEFLTGRPMSSSESHAGWFQEQFAAEQGNLSDGQIMTLFVWLHAERLRMQQKAFLLPVNGHAVQFVEVRERAVIQA